MSFRITIPRIAALIAVALTNLEARPAPVVVAPSPEGTNLRRLERAAAMANAHFADGHRKGIISIVAEILDVSAEDKAKVLAGLTDIDESRLENPWKVGDIIVPLGNPNSHAYTLNEPCINFGGSYFLRVTGGQLEKGDDMTRAPGHWRFATREEIEAFDRRLRDIQAGKDAGGGDKLLAAMGLLPKPAPAETLAEA